MVKSGHHLQIIKCELQLSLGEHAERVIEFMNYSLAFLSSANSH